MTEKPVILVELLLKLKIVVSQGGEDGKNLFARKQCSRKIYNGYRMFTLFIPEALVAGRAIHEAKGFKGSTISFDRQPVLGVQSLFEASNLATEVTPKAKRLKTALVKMKMKDLREDL